MLKLGDISYPRYIYIYLSLHISYTTNSTYTGSTANAQPKLFAYNSTKYQEGKEITGGIFRNKYTSSDGCRHNRQTLHFHPPSSRSTAKQRQIKILQSYLLSSSHGNRTCPVTRKTRQSEPIHSAVYPGNPNQTHLSVVGNVAQRSGDQSHVEE